MFFGGDDEDPDFSSSTGKSKLGSLFDMDRAASQGGNESLTYTAPKEPKKRPEPGGQSSGGAAAPAVLCAGVAFAYKFKDDKYVSEGKLGVAVIGTHSNNDYKLLLYRTKDKPVTFAKTTSSFVFTVQPNNYVNFYDDSRQSWSLMFDSESALDQFAKQVAVSKFCSTVSSKADLLISQDLSPGEGQTLENGDNIEIKYSCWQLENNAIGSAVESGQLFRFRIGKQKGIRAWEEGVVGMKKNGKRLLVCVPSLATGGEFKAGKFPSGSSLVFEVEILRVKYAKEKHDEAPVPSVPTAVPPVVAEERDDERDDGIKAKTKSIEDQMAQQSAKTDKAKLISRMAKMGQPMLPVVVPTQAENYETESPSPSPNPRPEVPSKPVHHGASVHQGISANPTSVPMGVVPETVFIPPNVNPMGPMMAQPHVHAPVAAPTMMSGAAGQLSVYHSQVPLPFQAMMGGYPGQAPMIATSQPYGNVFQPNIYPVPPMSTPQAPPPVSQPASDTSIPMMLMETRNQNTEVRVSLSRVSDKIDRISEKLDQLNNRQSNALAVSSSMPTMEVGMLVHNIERIVMENERLKKDNMEKSSRVEDQNIKIAELLQRNQLYVEQSNAFLEQRNDSYKTTASQSQAKVQALEQEKVQFAMDLSMTTSQLASCQLEIASLKKREGELKQQLDRLTTTDIQSREDASTMRLRLTEQDQRLEQLGIQVKEEQQDRKFLLKQVEELKDNLRDVTLERDNLDRNLNERKKKAAEENIKAEAELKETQTRYEEELAALKQQLRNERNSTESSASQKLTQIEDDLNREWKDKSDRLLSNAQEKHQRELAEIESEKAWLKERVDNLESKLTELKASRSTQEQEKDALQEKLDQLQTWKDKYDSLRSQATLMKDRYEQRLKELEEERSLADDEREKAEVERDKALEKAKRLQIQQASLPPGGSTESQNTKDTVVAEVKKIMNTVYRRLRQEFGSEGTYSGADIQKVILDNIKAVTLEMMQTKETAPVQDSVTPNTENVSVHQEERVVQQAVQLSTSSPLKSEPVAVSPVIKKSSHGPEAEISSDAEKPQFTSQSRNLELNKTKSDGDGGGLHEETRKEDITDPHLITGEGDRITVEMKPADIVDTESRNNLDNNLQLSSNIEVSLDKSPLEIQKETNDITNDQAAIDADDDDSFASFGSGDDDDVDVKQTPENVIDERSMKESADPLQENKNEDSVKEEIIKPNEPNQVLAEVDPLTKEVKLEENLPTVLENASGSNDVKTVVDPLKTEEKDELFHDSSVENLEQTKAPDDNSADVTDEPHGVESAKIEGNKVSEAVNRKVHDAPLFGEDDEDEVADIPAQTKKVLPKNSSLFGNLDDDEDGLFSVTAKQSSAETKMPSTDNRPSSATSRSKTSDNSSLGTKPKRTESDDDLNKKPPPLPLFGDSDDDKDLDWLS